MGILNRFGPKNTQFFLIFSQAPISPSCWMPCYRHKLFMFFQYFVLFKYIIPSQKFDINNNFRIIFIKIIIIKVNVIKIYMKNTHLISKKCNFTKIFIRKEYIIVKNKSTMKLSSILHVANQSGINFNAARQSSVATSHIF